MATSAKLPLADVQDGVRRGVALAALTTASAAGAAVAFAPASLADAVLEPSSSLALAAAWQLPKAAVLLWHVARVGNMRFRNAEISAGDGYAADDADNALQAELRVERALLTNTLEQTVASAISALGLAAVLEPRVAAKLLPAQAACFVVGRWAFARGYRQGAPGRAYGFGLTSLPTIAAVAGGLTVLAVRTARAAAR